MTGGESDLGMKGPATSLSSTKENGNELGIGKNVNENMDQTSRKHSHFHSWWQLVL